MSFHFVAQIVEKACKKLSRLKDGCGSLHLQELHLNEFYQQPKAKGIPQIESILEVFL